MRKSKIKQGQRGWASQDCCSKLSCIGIFSCVVIYIQVGRNEEENKYHKMRPCLFECNPFSKASQIEKQERTNQ